MSGYSGVDDSTDVNGVTRRWRIGEYVCGMDCCECICSVKEKYKAESCDEDLKAQGFSGDSQQSKNFWQLPVVWLPSSKCFFSFER